jgi:ribosomal protein L40E
MKMILSSVKRAFVVAVTQVSEWTCGNCNYNNPDSATTCAQCGDAKGAF